MVKLSPLCHVQNAHEGEIWCCAFTRDGRHVVTGANDEVVHAWTSRGDPGDVKDDIKDDDDAQPLTRTTSSSTRAHALGCVSMDCDPNAPSRCAVTALDGATRCVDVDARGGTPTPAPTIVSSAPPGQAWGVAFDPTPAHTHGGHSRLAIAGGSTSTIAVVDIDERGRGARRATMAFPEPSAERFARSVAYSPDGSRIACGAMDGAVGVFDAHTGTFLHALRGHARPVRDVAFARDGKTVYTACDDGYCHVYDAHNRSLIDALGGHTSWVLSVCPSPTRADVVVTTSSDCSVKLWDVSARACAQTMSDHVDAVWCARFSPDGARLLACSSDASFSVFTCV